MTRDQTISWSLNLTQTIEILRAIRLNLDQQRIVKDVGDKLESNYETSLELDFHANTCVLGHDALIILDYQQPVSIVGYDEFLRSKTYQTVSGVVPYDDPQTGRTLHLIINQAIHIPHLDYHLLCPMQCRVNDVTVNDLPKFLVANPTDEKICPSRGSIGQTWSSLGVDGRSFSQKRSARNGGVLQESSV
jgi:hypothetical protein